MSPRTINRVRTPVVAPDLVFAAMQNSAIRSRGFSSAAMVLVGALIARSPSGPRPWFIAATSENVRLSKTGPNGFAKLLSFTKFFWTSFFNLLSFADVICGMEMA